MKLFRDKFLPRLVSLNKNDFYRKIWIQERRREKHFLLFSCFTFLYQRCFGKYDRFKSFSKSCLKNNEVFNFITKRVFHSWSKKFFIFLMWNFNMTSKKLKWINFQNIFDTFASPQRGDQVNTAVLRKFYTILVWSTVVAKRRPVMKCQGFKHAWARLTK